MESQVPLVIENQVNEKAKIDVNEASAEELDGLPGIGPVLAQRIVSHRETAGPFVRENDIAQVSGIGPQMAERIADRLTVLPQARALAPVGGLSEGVDIVHGNGSAPSPLPDAEPEPMLEADEEPIAMRVEPLPFDDSYQAMPTVVPPMQEGEGEGEPPQEKSAEAPEAVEEQAIPAPVPTPLREKREARRWTWVWSSLLGAVLGGLLGMILALLVFAGINGAVDVSRTQAFGTLRGQINSLGVETDAIRGDVSTLQGDLSGLRQRVEVLSGLTARMEQAESTLETFTGVIQALQKDSEALQQSVDTLTQDVDGLGKAVDAVEIQTEKAMTFFEQLRSLLDGIFGTPEPQGASPAGKGVTG